MIGSTQRGDVTTVTGEEFVGGTQQIDDHIFNACTFTDVELHLEHAAFFLFSGCTFSGNTRLTLGAAPFAMLAALLAQRDQQPVDAFLRDTLAKLDHLPQPTVN